MKITICLLLIATLARSDALGANYFGGKSHAPAPARSQPKPSGNSLNTYHNDADKNAKTLRSEQQMNNDGSYHYEYQTANGISAQEQGTGGVAVQGSSSYVSPEGVEIKLSYTADETGYHPVGDHIPKTPDYVLRALEYIRTHPYKVKDYYSGETKIAPIAQILPSNVMAPPVRPTHRRITPPANRNYNNYNAYNKGSNARSQYQNRNSIKRFRF